MNVWRDPDKTTTVSLLHLPLFMSDTGLNNACSHLLDLLIPASELWIPC